MSALPDDLEEALHRVATLGAGDDGAPMTVTASSRRGILEHLIQFPGGVTAEDLATGLELHITTVRHHLDVLSAAGLVERRSATPVGRGRPKTLYLAATDVAASYSSLVEHLDRALRAGKGDAVAMDTALQWAQRVAHTVEASTPDEAVGAAVEALRTAGFDARADEVGDTVLMRNCPYASLIAQHPLICTVHAELVQDVLERTGQPVRLESFEVWVRPGVCRARLSRPDVGAEFRVIPTARENLNEEAL